MRGWGRGRLGCYSSDHVVVLRVEMLTLADFSGWLSLTVTLAPVFTVPVTTVILAIAHILHLAVTVGAPRPVAVATCVIVALTAIVLAGREGVTLTARRGAATARGALTATTTLATLAALRALTTGAVTSRVETP
jgi:hypothetical protein